MGSTRSIVRGLVIGVATVAIGLVAGPAFAAAGGTGHTVTMTEHQHGTFEEPEATNPCTGAPGVAIFDGNAVEHVTYFPDGDEVWATFTETGSVAAVGASGTTYEGRATAWGNFNVNERNSNNTFTLSFRVQGSDGSSFYGHETMHITYNGNGVITVNFDNFSLTC